MTQTQYEELTPAQRDALLEVFARNKSPRRWAEFLESAFPHPILGCVMVPWAGMWLGIEKDGHTHS